MQNLELLKKIQGWQFFEQSLISQKYDDIDSLGEYIKSSITKNLVEIGFLDNSGNLPLLSEKLLYGLFTFFDHYREDWLTTSYINFWGNKISSNDRKIVEGQQDYYRSLGFSTFEFEYFETKGYQKWSAADHSLLFSNCQLERGKLVETKPVIFMKKIGLGKSRKDFTQMIIEYKDGKVSDTGFFAFVNTHFVDTDEEFNPDIVLSKINSHYTDRIKESGELRGILNFLLFQSYASGWKYFYVFAPNLNMLSGSLFLYLYEDFDPEEILLFQSLSNQIFSQMMLSFALNKLQK